MKIIDLAGLFTNAIILMMLTDLEAYQILGLSPKIVKPLMEAGVLKPSRRSLSSGKTLATLPKSVYVDPDDIKAFHNSERRSKVDSSKSVLERQNQLLSHFDERFDELMCNLRTGSVNEENLQRLKGIAADPDFDFFIPFPKSKAKGEYEYTPFEKILELSVFDPEQNLNREIEPRMLDDLTKQRMRNSSVQCCQEITNQCEDRFLGLLDNVVIPAERSFTYAKTSTELTIELLSIANRKGFPVNDHRIPEIIFQESTANLQVLDWLIDSTDLAADISGFKPVNLTKLGARLEVLPTNNSEEWDEINSEYREKMHAEIEDYFYKSFSNNEKYKNYDPVKLLVHYSNKLPEELLMKLIKFADAQEYDFKSSYLLSAYEDESINENVDKPNLLSLAISPHEDFDVLPSVELVKFLLEKGVNPFEERTVNVVDKEGFDLFEILEQLAEAIESDDTDSILEILGGQEPSELMSAFEANLLYLAELSDYEPDEMPNRQDFIDNRVTLAKLMSGYKSG